MRRTAYTQGLHDQAAAVQLLGTDAQPAWCKLCKRLWVEPENLFDNPYEVCGPTEE